MIGHRRSLNLLAAMLCGLLLAVLAVGVLPRPAGAFTIDGHTFSPQPGGILSGDRICYSPNGFSSPQAFSQDGSFWFQTITETEPGYTIGRRLPDGTIMTYPGFGQFSAIDMTQGPDGQIWFTNSDSSSGRTIFQVVRINEAGVIDKFPVPQNYLRGIASGPDGNIWFVADNSVVKMTPEGELTEFPLPTPNAVPINIVAGGDGNLWFTEAGPWPQQVGRVTPSGSITEFNAFSWGSLQANPGHGMTLGPDGNVWYTSAAGVTGITPEGNYIRYFLGNNGSADSIVAGGDGDLWFTEPGSRQIAHFTPGGSGALIEQSTIDGGDPRYAVSAPTGDVWITNGACVDVVPAGRSVPTAPQDLGAVPDVRAIHFSWSPPSSDGGSDITAYVLYRDGQVISTLPPTTTSWTDEPLGNGETHGYAVAAVTAVGEGTPSSTSATTFDLPSAPTGLVAAPGVRSIHLSWFPPSDGGSPLTGYRIYRNGHLLLTVPPTMTSWADDRLGNGEVHAYAVSAVTAVGEGTRGSSAHATTFDVASAPQDLKAAPGARIGEIRLEWKVPASDGGTAVHGYRLYRGTDPNNLTPVADLGADVRSYVDGGRQLLRTYYYRLSALNAAGQSSVSNQAHSKPAPSVTVEGTVEVEVG